MDPEGEEFMQWKQWAEKALAKHKYRMQQRDDLQAIADEEKAAVAHVAGEKASLKPEE